MDGEIEQRWFVGAHANIGGGYPDNRLAERPLQWLLEGARDEGLIVEKLPDPATLTHAQVRPNDSYAEFAKPLWTMVLRAKRHYRLINPKPELRANRDEAKNKGQPKAGFSLVSIHETVDDSVLQYWSASKEAPPNLVEWAQRQKQVETQPDRAKHLAALANKACPGAWPGDGWLTQFGLALWAILAAAGLQVAHQFFRIWPGAAPPFWVLCVIAGLLPLVDWAESFVNARSARHGFTPRRRAFSDSIYWTRALGVVLFAFGLCGTIVDLGAPHGIPFPGRTRVGKRASFRPMLATWRCQRRPGCSSPTFLTGVPPAVLLAALLPLSRQLALPGVLSRSLFRPFLLSPGSRPRRSALNEAPSRSCRGQSRRGSRV